ncbi:MAG: methyltransferase type 11 [Methylibium sp. NZG]|nr:MAG: methyltransferase type 11 [Methylibium sp. NZG]
METSGAIIGLAQWLQTPAGRYVLEWEQRHLDVAVADLFGFHALQLGLPELDTLRANRMPHRWVATDTADHSGSPPASAAVQGAAYETDDDTLAPALSRCVVALHCDFDALPFDSQSLDLVVLPHGLELARDPHLALREVERVLVPEGRVVVVGFNPTSLWGLRQRLGHVRRRIARGGEPSLFLPSAGEFMGYRRLRDWLRLLSFEVEAGRFGCYRPPLLSDKWLARLAWMEQAGERWWPVFGAVYFVVAVKRVRGMRLVGLVREQRQRAKAAPAVAVHHHQDLLQPHRPSRSATREPVEETS